jgi:hypothetical protein
MSSESGMLVYPKIDIVIRPLRKGSYQIYHESAILARFQSSSAAFTTLGIIPSNGHETSFYKGTMYDIHKTTFDIQQSNSHLFSVNDFLEAYVNIMNAQTENPVTFENYKRSYGIFSLQEKQLSPSSYGIRYNYLHKSYHYLNKTNAD